MRARISPGVAIPCPASPPIPIAKSTLAIFFLRFCRVKRRSVAAWADGRYNKIVELNHAMQVFNRASGTFTAGNKAARRARLLTSARRMAGVENMLHQLHNAEVAEAELLGDLNPLL